VLSLTRYVKTLEEIFRAPIDVEWALEKDREFILQARPITSYVNLPRVLKTAPGKRRKLYCDVTLSVQAIEKPMSRMATSVICHLAQRITSNLFGDRFISEKGPSLVIATAGRLYAVISHYMQIFGKDKVAAFVRNLDPIVAQCIAEV